MNYELQNHTSNDLDPLFNLCCCPPVDLHEVINVNGIFMHTQKEVEVNRVKWMEYDKQKKEPALH